GRDALLLRGADAARDRRGARRDRVARLAAAHEGDPAPEGAPLGLPGPNGARELTSRDRPSGADARRHPHPGWGSFRPASLKADAIEKTVTGPCRLRAD